MLIGHHSPLSFSVFGSGLCCEDEIENKQINPNMLIHCAVGGGNWIKCHQYNQA